MDINHSERLSAGQQRYGARNAYGRKTVAGYPGGTQIAFIHCQHCDEQINESRIEEHLHDGHDVEVVMKPPKTRENASKAQKQLDAIIQRAVEGYQINIMDLGKVQKVAEDADRAGQDVTAAVHALLDKIATKTNASDIKHSDRLAEGQRRYGLLNAPKCSCGGPINPSSSQPFVEPMCDACIAEEKQYQKGERDYERENDSHDTCECGHIEFNHPPSYGGKCEKCSCKQFEQVRRENALECPVCGKANAFISLGGNKKQCLYCSSKFIKTDDGLSLDSGVL